MYNIIIIFLVYISAKKIVMTHENISDDTDIIRKSMDIQTELISSRDSVGEIRCSPLERSVYIHRPVSSNKYLLGDYRTHNY